jgi:hypothetical protein
MGHSIFLKTKTATLFKIGDLLFWGCLLAILYWGWVFMSSPAGENSIAIVEIAGEARYHWDLQHDEEYSLDEFSGAVKVQVKNGAVKIIKNNCHQQICLKMGPVSRTGEMIVCVPNKILIYIPTSHDKPTSVKAITG